MKDNALLAFWAYCFAGGLHWTFKAVQELTEYYWPVIAGHLH